MLFLLRNWDISLNLSKTLFPDSARPISSGIFLCGRKIDVNVEPLPASEETPI